MRQVLLLGKSEELYLFRIGYAGWSRVGLFEENAVHRRLITCLFGICCKVLQFTKILGTFWWLFSHHEVTFSKDAYLEHFELLWKFYTCHVAYLRQSLDKVAENFHVWNFVINNSNSKGNIALGFMEKIIQFEGIAVFMHTEPEYKVLLENITLFKNSWSYFWWLPLY